MKSLLKSLLTAAFVGLAVLPALSLAQPPAGGEKGGGRGRGGMPPEQRVAQIDEAVKLTADQKTKITAIYTKAAADMQALAQEDRRTKGGEIRTAADKEARALLTPEQQPKFDAIPAPTRGGNRGGADGGNAPKKQ